MVPRLCPAVSATHWLLSVAILQELDQDVVELHEANVEPLVAPLQIRHADRSRIDLPLPSDDLLIGHQRVMDLLPMKIAITHYLVAAEYLGVELEGAIHVVDRNTEMLHSLKAGAEGCAVAVSRDGSPAWTGGALGKRRDAHCESGSSNAADCGTTCSKTSLRSRGATILVSVGLLDITSSPCSEVQVLPTGDERFNADTMTL